MRTHTFQCYCKHTILSLKIFNINNCKSLASEQRWRGWKCSWVITRYRCYLWWEVNLSDLLGAAQRPEFKVGDPGATLAAGLAEQHQPATTCILLLSQPPWILYPRSTRAPSSLTSLICIPAISYSHSSYLHLICPSHSLNSTSMASAANAAFILSPGWFSDPATALIYHPFYLPQQPKWFPLAPLKFKWRTHKN